MEPPGDVMAVALAYHLMWNALEETPQINNVMMICGHHVEKPFSCETFEMRQVIQYTISTINVGLFTLDM